MERLLNISTHSGELKMFADSWEQAGKFLEHWDFDGFELYPVSKYPFYCIPQQLISGIHLRFFIILAPIWRGDKQRLLKIFGDWRTVEHFYGGRNAEWIATFYAGQLDLVEWLGCSYVVFHPVHCELEYIYSWKFPWKINDTLDLCAEVLNAATRQSSFTGKICFENLWWPGSFRLDSAAEFDYLLSRVEHPNCGIVLDIGHLLNTNPKLRDEREATSYVLAHLDHLGEIIRHIHVVHLSKSLSGNYIRKTRSISQPFAKNQTFWECLDQARHHVGCIDRHEPFATPLIGTVLERLDPAHVVFEFTWSDKAQWEGKIAVQKKALHHVLWPETPSNSLSRPPYSSVGLQK